MEALLVKRLGVSNLLYPFVWQVFMDFSYMHAS